ncbi:MAG: hypothetical protein II309_08820 [Bacilli bacterium]|jgi:hypothetical protein|nr:hypothetical protein [Bacilli bacterium]
MKNLILDYIKCIKQDDIKLFALKNGVKLNDDEIENIINIIKKPNILDLNDEQIEELIKNNISDKNYHKVYKLYLQYKKRYKSYL